MTRLGRAASKSFGLEALEIPWIDLGRTRGSKSQMARTTRVPFQINPGDGFATAGSIEIRGVKPSMAGVACPLFGAGTLESTGDSMISLTITEVRGAGGIPDKNSCKYSSQSFLDPTNIALWLVLAWLLGEHRLAAMQLFLRVISLSIQMIPQSARL